MREYAGENTVGRVVKTSDGIGVIVGTSATDGRYFWLLVEDQNTQSGYGITTAKKYDIEDISWLTDKIDQDESDDLREAACEYLAAYVRHDTTVLATFVEPNSPAQ